MYRYICIYSKVSLYKLSCQTLPLRLFRAVCGAFRHGSLLGFRNISVFRGIRRVYLIWANLSLACVHVRVMRT